MSLQEKLPNQQPKTTYSVSETEEIFLGAVISGVVDGEWLTKARRELFFNDVNKSLFDMAHRCYLDNGFIDYLLVVDELGKLKGKQEAKAIVDKLTKSVPNEFNPISAVELLEEVFLRKTCNDVIERARLTIQQNPHSAPEILFTAYEKVNDLSKTTSDYDLLKEFDKAVDDIIEGTSHSVIPTGIPEFDALTGGISTKEITIIGARPGHGKTTSSVALALSILDANPNNIVVKFELEMSKEAIYHKFLSNVSNVSSTKIRQSQLLSEDEKKRVREGAEKLKQYKGRLFIYDNVYNIFAMNKICRAIGATVAMVDFITLMEGIEENPRWELGRILINAKKFAKAHNMGYIFFSQINRGAEARDTKMPQMSDLSESDMLTQLASEIILLFYKYKYTFDPIDKYSLRLIFDKARYSSIGEVKLHFDPEFTVLKSMKGKPR